MQLRHQLTHAGPLQAIHANGHALEPVNIEGVDGVLIVGQLIGCTGEAEHIARRIDQQKGVVAGERLEQFLHLDGRDVMQREQSRRQPIGGPSHRHFGHQFARHRLIGRQDHVTAALTDHRVVGP